MKNLFFLLTFGVSSLKVFSQLIAEYHFDAPCVFNCTIPTNDCVGAGTALPFYVNLTILASAGPVYLGPGVSGVGTNGCGPMNGFAVGETGNPNRARWANAWPNGFNLNDHFGLNLVAAASTIIFIDSVKWREQISNASSSPTSRQLRTSADAYTNPIWTGSNSTTSWTTQKVTSGLPSFSTSLDIRIYGYASTNTASSLRIDSLRIYAHIYSTLPVELLSFAGKAISQDVELAWTTGSELGNDHFKVMRSDDGQAWTEIGRVPGSGTTNLPRDYGFLDRDPSVGTNYYKLRQVDWDGQYEDSPTISVDVGRRNWFRLVADGIVSDEPTTLFDELGRTLSGPSREHRIARTGIFLLREERSARSERLFLFTEP